LPPDIALLLGKHEIVRSLNTRIVSEAARLHIRHLTCIDEAIGMMRAIAAEDKLLAEQLFAQWFDRKLQDDFLARSRSDITANGVRSHTARDELGKAVSQFVANFLGQSPEELRAADTALQLLPDANADLLRHLTHLIMRAEDELRGNIARLRTTGDFADTIQDPVVAAAVERGRLPALRPASIVPAAVATQINVTPSLRSLMDSFVRELRGSWEQKTKLDYDHSFKLAIELWGPDVDIACLTKANAREYKTLLLDYPANATKKYPRSDIKKAVELGKMDGATTLAPKSINKKLSNIRHFFAWCKDNGFVTDNIFGGIFVPDRVSPRGKRDPFTPAQLCAIFTGGVYDQHAKCDRQPTSRDAEDYWIPLIGYLTGMRLGEIAQLTTDDVRKVHGVWIFEVHDRGGNSLKTNASRRRVPVHNLLIDLGLVHHRQCLIDAGEHRLFPRLEPASDGFESSAFSKRFARYLTKIGVKSDRRVSFHSFRHTMKDMLRAAGVQESVQREILGHEDGSAAAGYGHGFTTASLKAELEKIELPFRMRAEPPTA
jgi:integrase